MTRRDVRGTGFRVNQRVIGHDISIAPRKGAELRARVGEEKSPSPIGVRLRWVPFGPQVQVQVPDRVQATRLRYKSNLPSPVHEEWLCRAWDQGPNSRPGEYGVEWGPS